MDEVRQFPRRVREVEHLTIPLKDGCRLAARLWLPVDAEDAPVPAILEYLPYRKRDGTALRDGRVQPYLAGHGYGCLRVDIRGNGESEGLMADEYTAQELSDGVEVIAWAAEQPWCSGSVGMMGISWGGFNALQIAALRPEPLKAIVTVCSTDDRYADDIHYLGGCLLNDNLTWSSQMLAYSARPPDPALVGARWKTLWLERLEAMPLLAAEWLRHQHRDGYWKHGSVCENYGDIQAAVFAVGGWADGYPRAIPRLLKNLQAPALGLIGPWVHAYPHLATPAPAIGYLQEILRWWDHWLKGQATGIMAEPRLRAYMLDSRRPATEIPSWPGRWISEPAWPSPNIETLAWHLNPEGLSPEPGAEDARRLCSPLTTGVNCGSYCPGMRLGDEHPGDQREEDAGSLVFDSPPLNGPMEILGAPVVELRIASDRPVAQVTARLCDLHPDGASTRVSYMPFNLTHRGGHAHPQPMVPGDFSTVRIALKDVAYGFPEGHRIRVALSSAYWPMVWPAPQVATLQIVTGISRLLLPLRPARAEPAVAFEAAEGSPGPGLDILRVASGSRTIERAAAGGAVTVHTLDDFGAQRFQAHGLEVGSTVRQSFSIAPDDPLSAETLAAWTQTVGRGDWQTRTETQTRMWSDEKTFYLEAKLAASEGDTRVFEKTWQDAIPRDLV
jgi:putative CocE/NonD family hydrolase